MATPNDTYTTDNDVIISHHIDPAQKDDAWAAAMMNDFYKYGGAESMLQGKRVSEIDKYYSGDQPVNRYKKMFRRMAKELAAKMADDAGEDMLDTLNIKDITGIDWKPLGILANPMSSVHNMITKLPLYVKATAIDSLAQEKKQEDRDFIRNRPVLDKSLDEFGQKLKIKIGSPAAKNNAESVDISNFDLNPGKEDELNFYMTMFHKLRPESAFEAALLAIAYTQQLKSVRDLEGKDQLKYAKSAHRAYFSDITGLPSIDYLFPGNVYTPPSDLPDYSDVSHKYVKHNMTMEQFMDSCGNDLTEDEAIVIFDTYFRSMQYTYKWSSMDRGQRKKATIPVIYMEFKSWDTLNFHKKETPTFRINELVNYNFELSYSRNHPDRSLRGKRKKPTPEEFTSKRYVQYTYCGYWLDFFPDRVFKYKKLEGSKREAGKESMSLFSIHTLKTKDKSDVELSIPLVDDAQRAYFKLQHAIIMAKPKGAFIDLKFLRNAVDQMKETDVPMTMKMLLGLFADNNIMMGDSEGFDPNEQQSGARPFYEIPGGVGQEVEGFLMVINDAMQKIGKLTGTDGLTNQTPNPEGLVGLQRLMLQNSQNSVYYLLNAVREQTEACFRTWAPEIQYILSKKGTPSYDAIVSIIGAYKVAVIEDLETVPLHQFGIMVESVPTEQEQAELNQVLMEMLMADRISTGDWVTLRRVFSWKDAQQLFAIRENKQRERKQQEMMAQIQAGIQQKQIEVQGKLQNTQMSVQGNLKKEQMQNETDKWLSQFDGRLQMMLQGMQGGIKKKLQDDRGIDQLNKVRETASLQQQKPIVP